MWKTLQCRHGVTYCHHTKSSWGLILMTMPPQLLDFTTFHNSRATVFTLTKRKTAAYHFVNLVIFKTLLLYCCDVTSPSLTLYRNGVICWRFTPFGRRARSNIQRLGSIQLPSHHKMMALEARKMYYVILLVKYIKNIFFFSFNSTISTHNLYFRQNTFLFVVYQTKQVSVENMHK